MRWSGDAERVGMAYQTIPTLSVARERRRKGGVCAYLSSGVLRESAAAFRRALSVLNLFTKVSTQEAIQERGMFL